MLKNYKNKVCKTCIGKLIQKLVFNTYYQLGFMVILIVLSGISSNIFYDNDAVYNALFLIQIIGWCGISIIALVALVYAFIINPLSKK